MEDEVAGDSVEEMELVKVTSRSLNRGRMPHEVTRDVKEDVVEVITVTCAKEVAKEVKFHRSYGTRLCY